MSLLLNSLIVSEPTSKFYNQKINILIGSDGIIKKISKRKINNKSRRVIDCKSKKVSVGWIDFNSNFCDPGNEYKEDLNSGINLASKSGFRAFFENATENGFYHACARDFICAFT